MSNFNFSDCRKAVNQAAFRPTAVRKAEALKLLMEAVNFVNNLEEVAEPSKKATKRRRKTTKSKKATPSQKVADRQEKAFHGKADSPVKPSKKAKTASVEAARESAKAVSVATGAAARAAKKAELKAEALEKEAEASRISSLEEKIEMLTKLMALQMQGEPTQVETVSFDEIPFEL
jgi:hypothetical protein